MTSPTPIPHPPRVLITPMAGEDLLDPGAVFLREELARRVLSMFWRDCCCPLCFSRAPAPVVELATEACPPGQKPRRVRAWWLFVDGIIEDADGPYSERLRIFFGEGNRVSELWPRYEFQIFPEPFEVRMGFRREPLAGWQVDAAGRAAAHAVSELKKGNL